MDPFMGVLFNLRCHKLPRRLLGLPFATLRGLASLKRVDPVLYVNTSHNPADYYSCHVFDVFQTVCSDHYTCNLYAKMLM